MSNESRFSTFLSRVTAQQEVSLVIANSSDQVQLLSEELSEQGFRQVIDSTELMNRIRSNTKAYYIVRDTLPKQMRDVIVQFPTGQIEIFDHDKMKSEVVVPDYEQTGVVFVATAEKLQQIEKEGFNFLEHVGLTYRE